MFLAAHPEDYDVVPLSDRRNSLWMGSFPMTRPLGFGALPRPTGKPPRRATKQRGGQQPDTLFIHKMGSHVVAALWLLEGQVVTWESDAETKK